MKESSVQIRYKDNPVLLDKILQDMQKSLMEKLKWLNYAFGRAYKLVEHRPDGNKFIYPAMYNGNSEYVNVINSRIENTYLFCQMTTLVIFHGLIYMTRKKLLK